MGQTKFVTSEITFGESKCMNDPINRCLVGEGVNLKANNPVWEKQPMKQNQFINKAFKGKIAGVFSGAKMFPSRLSQGIIHHGN